MVRQTDRVETFRKHRRGAPAGFFRVEAAGLAWLDAPGAVRVARVLDVGDDFIELERLSVAPATPAAAVRFGRELAALHDSGAPAFGCPPAGWSGDGFIGDAPLPLRDLDGPGQPMTWGAFYARHRIRPYLHAVRSPVFERLCDRLEAGDFDDAAPPARIHGDLWSGNVLWTPTGAALIDPAAHGGHRITDLAMLSLFGAPHLGRVLASYAEASEHLPDGWRDLVGLHQVHPLLVHAVLFGSGYAAQAERAASRFAA